MTAIGYVRRSKESTAKTVSLEDQSARIEEYSKAQSWTLAEVVTDDGVSGGRRDRLARLQERVKATGARVVIVYHLDRFARDVAAMLDSVRAFSRKGIELHVVGRGRVEVASASGLLLTGVEGLMAEHYRVLIGEKTRDALARLRATGRRYTGILPYGFSADTTGVLVQDPTEQYVLRLVCELRAARRSLRRIAGDLAARGILARNGRPFAPMVLARLVARA